MDKPEDDPEHLDNVKVNGRRIITISPRDYYAKVKAAQRAKVVDLDQIPGAPGE